MPTIAELRNQLEDAEGRFILAGYIDNFSHMKAEQARYAARIQTLKNQIAAAEAADNESASQ